MSISNREVSQINHLIAMPSAKDKLLEMIKTYSETLDIKTLKEDFTQLAEAIENDERTKIYHVLNAKKYKVSAFLNFCEEALLASVTENVSVNIFTKKETIRCDKTSILKMLYKIANDHCKKIYEENSGDDKDLVLSFFDTKILYESNEESNEKNYLVEQ